MGTILSVSFCSLRVAQIVAISPGGKIDLDLLSWLICKPRVGISFGGFRCPFPHWDGSYLTDVKIPPVTHLGIRQMTAMWVADTVGFR